MKKKLIIPIAVIVGMSLIGGGYSLWTGEFKLYNIIDTYNMSASIDGVVMEEQTNRLEKEIYIDKLNEDINIKNLSTLPIYINKVEIAYISSNEENIITGREFKLYGKSKEYKKIIKGDDLYSLDQAIEVEKNKLNVGVSKDISIQLRKNFDLKDVLKDINSKIERASSNIDKLDRQLDKISRDKAKISSQINKLTQKNEAINRKIQQVQEASSQCTQNEEKGNSENESGDIDGLRDAKQEIKDSIASLRGEMDELDNESGDISSEKERFKEERDAYIDEKERLKDAYKNDRIKLTVYIERFNK